MAKGCHLRRSIFLFTGRSLLCLALYKPQPDSRRGSVITHSSSLLVVLYFCSHFCIFLFPNHDSLLILYALHITPQHRYKTLHLSHLNAGLYNSKGKAFYQYKLTGSTGHFQSPGFPYTYPNDFHFSWNLDAPKGCSIILLIQLLSVSFNIAVY